MRILVAGATGYVGSRLTAELLKDGHEVIAATRNPGRLAGFGWHDKVTGVALDADDPTSVRAAFAAAGPVDVIYYLVHAIGQPGFRDRDNAAAANVAQAAKDAGVGRIVYLGGFVPDDDILSDHLAGRAEVADALTVDDGPEVVWLGAAVIIGAGSTSFEIVRYVGDRLLLIPLPPWADYHMDPISIRDVLHLSPNRPRWRWISCLKDDEIRGSRNSCRCHRERHTARCGRVAVRLIWRQRAHQVRQQPSGLGIVMADSQELSATAFARV